VKQLLSLLLISLCAGTALAQSPAVLSKSNTDFMRGLINYRYYDLAEGLAKSIGTSSLADVEKSNIAILASDLARVKQRVEGNAAGEKDAIIAAIKLREASIEKAPEAADSDQLRAEVTDQYGNLANAYKDTLAEEKDPKKQADLRKEGDALFDIAIKAMAAQKTLTEGKRVESQPETNIPFVIAFFNLGRLRYYRSLLFAPDSLEGKHANEQALESLDEFDLEFGDLLVAFEAKLIVSLCHKQLGKTEDAIAAVDEAIALRTRVDQDSKGVYKVEGDAASVISKAFAQKLSLLKDVDADEQRWDKILDSAKDYFATIPNPLRAEMGLAVLAAATEAHLMKGETAEAKSGSEKLIEEDPKGRWGYRGQQMLAELATGGGNAGASGKSGVDMTQLIGIANSLAASGESEKALSMCREIVRRTSGPDEAKFAAEAMMVTGVIFAQRKWFEEASLAYESVYKRHAKSTFAPEAVWRALNCYIELNGELPLPYWKRLIDERSKLLRETYADNAHVPDLQLIEAQQLEKASKFDKAAEAYEKIPADSTVALQARFGAANCYLKLGRKSEVAKQAAEAKVLIEKAKTSFRVLVGEIDKSKTTTTEAKMKARITDMDFRVRVALANLYLQEKPPQAAEVESLLKGIQLKEDDPNNSVIWALRIGALASQDRLDDAVSMFDAALQNLAKQGGGNQRPLSSIAGTIAQKLDERAAAASKGGLRSQANDNWRRAVSYYLRSAERATSSDDAIQIADRLFVIGLKLNGIEDKVEAFYEVPDLKLTDIATFEQAVELYDKLLQAGATNYRIKLARGRALGFLKRWPECVAMLSDCIAEMKLVDAKGRLNQQVWTQKSELISSYLELGFAMRNNGVEASDKALLARASDVFDRVFVGMAKDSKPWWFAQFGQLRTLIDRGVYNEADVMMRNLDRSSPDYDNDRFKLKLKFAQLKLEIKAPKK
jgi:tetratricopeptide (TPR) repeat protein